MVRDLDNFKGAKALRRVEAARDAQANLQTERQLAIAQEVLQLVGDPRTDAQAIVVADALDCAVDALCNLARTAEALRLAEDRQAAVFEITSQRSWFTRVPRSIAAIRVARTYAHAIELGGDPLDALHRLIALDVTVRRNPELGVHPVDHVLVLRAALSSAKRDGSAAARRIAATVRQRGDELAAEVEQAAPAAASGYWHRAACEQLHRSARTSDADTAAKLFQRSLPLRPHTPRDVQSRGMVHGELQVLGGDRASGARTLTDTAHGFERVLPRHHGSAVAQLAERDLLVAA